MTVSLDEARMSGHNQISKSKSTLFHTGLSGRWTRPQAVLLGMKSYRNSHAVGGADKFCMKVIDFHDILLL